MPSGSPNTASPATGDIAEFDLPSHIQELVREMPQVGHAAHTLFKRADFRMVLIAMRKGAVIKEHHADGTISVHVLEGQIRFTAQAIAHDLGMNTVLGLGASIPHMVEALEDSAFLLTIAWPPPVSQPAR